MQGVLVCIIGALVSFTLSAYPQSCLIDQRNDLGGFGWVSILPGAASGFLAQQFTPSKSPVAGFELYVVDFPDVPVSTGSVIRVKLLGEARTLIAVTDGYYLAPAQGDLFEPVLRRFVFTNPVPVIPGQPYFFVPYVAEGDNAATAFGANTYARGDGWNDNGPTGADFWFREFTDLNGPCDRDGDGILDENDSCPDTLVGEVVNSQGCSISDLVPCSGPLSGERWKNHGQYVAAVAKRAAEFVASGLITKAERNALMRRAATADCPPE